MLISPTTVRQRPNDKSIDNFCKLTGRSTPASIKTNSTISEDEILPKFLSNRPQCTTRKSALGEDFLTRRNLHHYLLESFELPKNYNLSHLLLHYDTSQRFRRDILKILTDKLRQSWQPLLFFLYSSFAQTCLKDKRLKFLRW